MSKNMMENFMKTQKQDSRRGFTLIEAMVSMAIGLVAMAAMASLFKTGMNSATMVAQRAETQQNMRAGIDLMVKDISMAGAGLPSGGIQLPSGAGWTPSKFACDQTGACHVPGNTYPNSNYMYGIIPGYSNGVEASAVIPAAPAAINDSVTSIYCDYNFPLFEYDVTFPSPGTSGVSINLAPDPAYTSPVPPALMSAGGIQVGDLIMLSNNLGTAVGEVTGITATSIAFANLDPLNINQNSAGSNNIKAISGGTPTVAYRLFAVTYYLTVPAAGQTPRLMRQVNGLTPVPVADNIINLQFAYDIYNSTTSALDANQANPIGVGDSPNLMQKINIVVMGQSMVKDGNHSQNLYLATSVSARNMAFRNRYQ
jgi:prepilin-type N-terminal cleavage/methylation domain-containing protein